MTDLFKTLIAVDYGSVDERVEFRNPFMLAWEGRITWREALRLDERQREQKDQRDGYVRREELLEKARRHPPGVRAPVDLKPRERVVDPVWGNELSRPHTKETPHGTVYTPLGRKRRQVQRMLEEGHTFIPLDPPRRSTNSLAGMIGSAAGSLGAMFGP